MKTYIVAIPIAGQMFIEVQADSKEVAIEAAWDQYNESGPEAFEVEWEAFERLFTGNVSHVSGSEQSATEVDESEDT